MLRRRSNCSNLLSGLLAVACVAPVCVGSTADELPPDLRAAIDAQRHGVQESATGFEARNPGQSWTTHFDGRGFVTTPDHGEWVWGLELASYGWGADCFDVGAAQGETASGTRFEYEWDERLVEWYVNDSRGLEHGFTVRSRPADARGPLRIDLAVRGGLEPRVSSDGRDVRFESSDGSGLDYVGLTVFDANGKALPAHFDATASGLQLTVSDANAHYPLTIDPVAFEAYLKAPNSDAGDWFGYAVAASEDTIVVGAPRETSSAGGVNGNQAINTAGWYGAAYVFVRDPQSGAWSFDAYLKASNPGFQDEFGTAVGISGDTIVVGALEEGSAATGVNGDESDESAVRSGAAYVFVRDPQSGTWSQAAYLKASNTNAHDLFGRSVAISGETIVVGASGEQSVSSGVNGVESDNGGSSVGAAYVFVRDAQSGAWTQQAYLKASNPDSFDEFGGSVAVWSDTLVVGASRERSSATGVNGNQADNSLGLSGAAYVFVRDSGTGTWSQQAYLKASNAGAGDFFGESVSVSGNTVVVGASFEDGSARLVNGNEALDDAQDSGAAYVFARDPQNGTWTQSAYLKASNTEVGDYFGSGVSVWRNKLVVGAWGERGIFRGVNASQGSNGWDYSGAGYVFVRDTGSADWRFHSFLKASNPGDDDHFGRSVAIAEHTLVVGAYGEDSGANLVNGAAADNSALQAGAAYAFRFEEPIATSYCLGDGSGAACPCGNSGYAPGGCGGWAAGSATLSAFGSTSVANDDLRFRIEGADKNQTSLLIQGSLPISIPWKDGLLCVGGMTERIEVVQLNPWGYRSTAGPIAALGHVVPGDTRYYQQWYRSPSSPCGTGSNFTQALIVVWD